jgi:hypothetical protein
MNSEKRVMKKSPLLTIGLFRVLCIAMTAHLDLFGSPGNFSQSGCLVFLRYSAGKN